MNESFFISAGWVIDGTGGPARSDVILHISSGRIKTIKKIAFEDLKNPDIVRLNDYTLLPGLVDSHVHLIMSGTDDQDIRKRQLQSSYEIAKQVIQKHLDMHLSCGVVALRDGGDYAGHSLTYKEGIHSASGSPVLLQVAGKAWHARGRYGKLIGRPPQAGDSLAGSIMKGHQGIDHIKIVNSGLNSLTAFARETPPQFGLKELAIAVKAGNTLGLRTMVHANGQEAVRVALEAGCHSIEHGFFMGRENLTRMADHAVPWVPTACTMDAYARTLPGGALEADIAKQTLDHQLDQIRTAASLGVPMALGTDAGSLGVHHGQAVREELRLFMTAGLSTEKAVQCATSQGAALLGLDRELGMLIPGMPATFLALRGRPENLIEALKGPLKIFFQGKEWMKRE